MFKKLVRRILYTKWVLEQKFRKKDETIWDDWCLNSNRPYIWDRGFLNKDGEQKWI